MVCGTPPKNSKALTCPVQNVSRAFPLERLHEEGVPIGQRQNEEVQLPQRAIELHQRLAKIPMRLSRSMHPWHEHLLHALGHMADGVFHRGVTTREPLLPQPFP